MQGHNHGHGGHTHHAGCSHGQQHYEEPEEYFKKLKEIREKNEEFYVMEILKGNVFAKKMETYGLSFINSLNAQVIQGVVGMAHMMLTCEWMPLKARPFISGMFWPLFLFLFVNYKIIVGFGTPSSDQDNANSSENINREINEVILFLPIIFYILCALKTSGVVNTPENKAKVQKILEVRPYLENQSFMCKACEIPKVFRAMHCPVCKQCIPKFSRHSLVFGVCVGAANELLALLFFFTLSISTGYFLFKFIQLHSLFGFITQLIFSIINISICYMSTVEVVTLFILNYYYGLTEFELSNWQMQQYLLKFPLREFQNPFNLGLVHNFSESLWALWGLNGFESTFRECQNDSEEKEKEMLKEEIGESSSLELPEIEDGKKYIVNWDKAYICIIPQMPNHPLRKEILSMMKIDEPRMIENFKLMKKFRKEIQETNPGLNEMQIQQQTMMKMQKHMAMNPQNAMQGFKPPPEQQKIILMQMLGHMKGQFRNDAEMFNSFSEIEEKLNKGEMTPDEANVKIRAIQQKIMQVKMEAILKAQQEEKMKAEQQNNQIDVGLLEEEIKTNPSNNVSSPNLQSVIQTQILQRLSEKQKEQNDSVEKKVENLLNGKEIIESSKNEQKENANDNEKEHNVSPSNENSNLLETEDTNLLENENTNLLENNEKENENENLIPNDQVETELHKKEEIAVNKNEEIRHSEENKDENEESQILKEEIDDEEII